MIGPLFDVGLTEDVALEPRMSQSWKTLKPSHRAALPCALIRVESRVTRPWAALKGGASGLRREGPAHGRP